MTYAEAYKNQQKKKNGGEQDFRVKYKTEVCKYWNAYGTCQFGEQCAFAHGKKDLRDKVHISTNYKTKKCIQFHENLYCPYGQRCQFLHSNTSEKAKELDNQGPKQFSYSKQIENPDLWFTHNPDCVCCMKKSRPRLPVFSKIVEGEVKKQSQIKQTQEENANVDLTFIDE